MGLLQACGDDPGRPGISAAVGIQMPAGEEDAVGGRSASGSKSRHQPFANAVIARVKTAECRLLARRGGSRDHDRMAAFGAKRTCMGIWLRLPRSRMTPSRTSAVTARGHSRPSSKVRIFAITMVFS